MLIISGATQRFFKRLKRVADYYADNQRPILLGFYVDLALKEVECRAVVRELEAVKLRLQQIEAEQEKTWINHITDSVSKFKFK